MKTPFIIIAIIACIGLFSCSSDSIKCLESKEVQLQIITPRAQICKTVDNEFHVVPSWDTTYTIMSECDAFDHINLLKESWNSNLAEKETNANDSERDRVYYEFLRDNPPSFKIED